MQRRWNMPGWCLLALGLVSSAGTAAADSGPLVLAPAELGGVGIGRSGASIPAAAATPAAVLLGSGPPIPIPVARPQADAPDAAALRPDELATVALERRGPAAPAVEGATPTPIAEAAAPAPPIPMARPVSLPSLPPPAAGAPIQLERESLLRVGLRVDP